VGGAEHNLRVLKRLAGWEYGLGSGLERVLGGKVGMGSKTLHFLGGEDSLRMCWE